MFKHNSPDSLVRARHKKTFFHRVGKVFTGFFREFNITDSAYIEDQHYNYTMMLQNTNTYELYTLRNKEGQSITFAPDMSWRLGPYLGWRWMFLGYTFDLKHINASDHHTSKKELDLSLYSSMLGVDLFWRQTGNDYHVERMKLGDDINTSAMLKAPFDGFKSSIKGFNLYYIFNHRKFSYPAAYAQSTVQRRSAGTMLLGIGYTRHKLEVDWDKLSNLVDSRLNPDGTHEPSAKIDSSLMFSQVKYSDVNVSCGYAYNWVFAKNWLFDFSLSMGLAYNQSSSDVEGEHFDFKNFDFKNVNVDGIGRFGLVWNNTKWYAGMSAIIHSYNYKKSQFSTNNSFGSINVYVGVNFGRKRNH
nr:DUF4421 domain-containing protein [uncultured Prevotella sp.]